MANTIRFTNYDGDVTPVEQRGVRAQYPQGYNGPAFGWVGRLSDLVANGGKIKLAEGFVPRRYAVRAEPMPGHWTTDYDLVGGDVFLKDEASVTIASSGTAAGVSLSGITIAGAKAASGSTPAADATTGLVAQGAVSGTLVGNDDTWLTVTATPASSGDVEKGVSDAYVEVLVYAEQVDPMPPKQF